jgi:hypothetical protein
MTNLKKTNLKKTTLTLTTLTLSALLLACGGEEARDLTRDESLESLGVNTKLGDRKDADGNTVKSDYHPLTTKRRSLAPLSELYFAGVQHNNKLQGLLDDNKDGALAELFSDSSEEWARLPLHAAKGDVDGDGFDEIVVVYYVEQGGLLKLRLIDRQSGQYVSSTTTLAKDVKIDLPAGLPGLGGIKQMFQSLCMHLALGDLDGDGRDELALSVNGSLRVLDDAKASFATLASRSLESSDKSTPITMLQLGVGNLKGEGKQELVVVANRLSSTGSSAYAEYYLYEGTLAKQLASEQLIVRSGATTHVFTSAMIAVGDIDGDRLDEVVFNARSGSGSYLVVLDDQRAGGAFLDLMAPVSGQWVALLDADADGDKEIVAGNQLLDYKQGKGLTVNATLGFALPPSNTTGDINGDFREDLIVYNGSAIRIWGMDETGAFKELKTLPAAGVVMSPALVAANTDDDSLIVEYTGKQELLFSDPQVVAVMAAAPAYSGIGQQDGSTTFGKTKGTEAETSASLGVSVSASIGAKGGFKLFGNGVEVEAKQTFTASMNATATAAVSISTSYAFTGGGDEDKVVFTAVPIDVYYYKVLSSPDTSAVGQVISINLPRKPQTFSVSRSYYNAHNGEAPDVDTETLSHNIGDPWSYPTRSDRDQHLTNGLALLKQGWVNASDPTLGGWVNDTMVTVGQGSGEQTLTIEANRSIGAGVEAELSSTTEVEATVGPVVAGGSLEFSVGVGLNVTVGEGFFVEGTIGDIPAEHFSGDKLYKAGLYAYPHQSQGGQSFMVVNYWVEK